jgi:glycerol-3-phosphate dehydrogenase subunit B
VSGRRRDGTIVVVGVGLSGLVAALRLAEAGRRVRVLATGVGSTHLSGATIDVLGYGPEVVLSPAGALPGFVAAHPDHPYARIGVDVLGPAVDWLKAHLDNPRYVGDLRRNFFLPTALGVAKPSAVAPQSMAAGDVSAGGRFVIVGLPGLKDFYPALVAANLSLVHGTAGQAIEARPVDVDVALDSRVDVGSLAYARLLDDPASRAQLAARLKGRVGAGEVVGMPAVLGLSGAETAWEELEARIGRPVFEIPTLPPSVPGIRLYRSLSAALRRAGAGVEIGGAVVGAETDGARVTGVYTDAAGGRRWHPAAGVVLATGGWAAGGLEMDSHWGAREPVIGLPVTPLPEGGPRFRPGYFEHHPLAVTGVAVDRSLRPVDGDGRVVYRNVRVVGATLAGAEPWKEKSGDGLSLATGYHAATSLLEEED